MAYTNPLDELKRLRMQTEQEYLRAREFATSRAKEIKTSPPDIGALRRRESEAGDYSRQKDPIVEAFQQPKKERSPILDAFSTGARTFSYITDRLISGATFGLSDVVGKAVESGISKISGKDIDINRGYQPSETVKAVGDVAEFGGGLLTGGMLLKGIKTVAAPALSKVATSITQFVKGIHPAVKAGAGIGAGATAFETTRGAIDPDYADRRDTFPSQFGAGLRVGTGQLLETAGAVAKWKEQDKLAKTLTSKGEAIREGFDEAEPVEFSWRAWFDPDFYAVNVARTIPMTAALIPAMFAGWKIGGGAGARLGLGPFARTVAASLGGATLSRPLESALEAGDTYDQIYQQEISKGKSEEEAHNIADRAAQEVFNKNLALVGMDAAQLAVAFAPYTRMGGRIGSMLANRIGQAGIAAGKLAFEAGSEAGEEALQYAFQQQAMGEEIDWSSPEAKEAMAIGGLFGFVLGGAGVVNDAVKARMAANLPPEQKTILSQSIENKLEQGMTEEEAVEQAFDEFAETPEGKEAIREITAEVANEIEEEVWKQIEALESFEMESAVEDKSPTAEEEIQPVSVEEPTAIESQEQVEIPEPVTLEEQVQPMATEEQVLPVAETETVAVPTPEVAADIAEPESQPEAVAETVSMPVEEKAVVEPAVEPVEEPVTEPSAPATEAVPVKKDRSKITATHLRKQAQAMQKTIDAKRNPAIAKQRPTARRANIAASMAKEADILEDIQTKVNIVAQAIEDGTIPESLAGITKKTQVETLRKLLKEKYPKMGATLGKYSAQDLLAATEGVKGSAQLRKNLKAKLDALGQDEYVIPIRTKAELQEIETLVRMAGDKLDNYTKRNIKDSLADFKRLLELGIDSQDKLDQAISDFKELTQDDGRPKEITKEQKIKAAERELIGTKIEGYFPTPKAVVERMLEEADIQPGMKVLEPSAGKGNIADAIREAEPQADLDVIEINSRLRDILEAKGHNIVGYDFLEYNEAKYDRIVMNPPFEKGQDIDHVKHAYDLLKPGGRVVSIMSEGPFFRGDKKAAEFRDWLEENEGTSEKLPEGSFKSSERPTGVATRLVVINKPEAVTETVQAQVPVQTEEITPLPTEVTIQTRIPSWELSTEQLVQRIKTLSNDPQSAYGLFVKERNLKPEINAKQFMQIWESVSANPHVRNLTTSFQPTHIDTLTGKQVQITDDGNVYKLVWENGLTGSEPKTLFDVKRYEPLGKVADTSLPADKEIESLLNEMQSRQSEEAVSLVFTIDKIKQAFNAVVDKWTFKGKLDSSGWAKQYQRAKIWEKNGKFRIYVPHDEYSQAGYVTMDANDVPKGSTSGQHKGLYYSAVSSQKEKTLISFIDDIIEYLNKEVKTSERAVEDQTAVAVGEGQVVRKGRISRIDNRLPLRDFRDKEYGKVNITRGKVYSGEPRTNIGENVLRKHQKDGVEHAIAAIDNYGGFILADGTGAGKTMQELVVAAHYAQHHNTVLIVVPNRAIINKAFRQDAQTLGIEGLLNVLGGESLPIKGKINLTTYASLKKVAGTDIDYVIFDEAHYLKNKGSAQSRTGKSVAAKAKGVLYATATPIDKAEHIHYLEGTGLFKNNSFSGIMRELGYAYEEMSIGGRTIGKWVRKVTRPEAESLLEAFFDELGDLGLIIKREISMDNIEVFVKTVPLPSEVHSKLAQIESYYNSLNVGEGLQKALALMAQRRWQEPYKVNVVMETIDNELKAGRQVVVFAARIEDSEVESIVLTDKSEGTLETLRSQLEEKGINVSAIYGSGNVDKAISDFQKGKTKVALVTPQKGGAGLSLDDVTGDAPRTMIIMTPPFSAVDNVQMAGRINRLTTKSKGRIIYLIADTDIDAWNMEIIASKMRSLNASVKGDVIKLDLTQTQKESAQQGIKFKAQPGTPEADLEVLRRAIKQRGLGPITINKVELAPEALSRPEFQAASAIAEKLGLRVVAFKGKGARGIQSGRTIYLNASLKDPLDYVFWHEVAHTMEVTHPEHYDRLMGIALDHIQDVHKLQSHYKAQDYALEDMPHEFAADVFAESLTTPGFFERLKNEAPELIKPLLEAIEQLIARIKQAISKDDSVLPYLRDVEALQERIRKEVVEPYFKDAIGEKQFVEMFGHKWQERYKLERSKKPVKETKFNLQNPEVQERMEAAAGIPQKTTRDKLTEVFEAFKRKISREYEWLPRTGEFAELRQALLNLGKQKSVSADKTIRALREIVEPMNEYEYSLFTYKVIFDDLAHEAAEGRLLPFGLTPEILEIEKAAVDRAVEQNAKVKEAIRKRKQIWDRIKREYIQANEAIGHKVDERLKKEDYYRHQVLEYANAKGITGTGRKLRTPSYRGYLRKRKGSTFDINTDYLQAEFEVMAQMHYDTMIARTIQVVKQHYDIVPQLKAQAIALNNENIMPIFEQMAESNVTAQKLYRMTLNKKQAIALNQLEKMAAKGELPDTPNGKYADVIEYMSARYLERKLKKDSAIDTDISFERVMSEDEYNKRLFEYLGWLTKQPTSQAKIAALTYFKGRKEKERFIKDRLGDAYVTWQDLIPEGYVEWQPREGSVFYMASSIPEHVAEALYSEALESVGVTGDMLKKVLAKGQKFPAMVVKEEVALTLDNLVTSINKDNPFVQVLRAWKQWQLISPKRFLKYNIRNFTGDLDALIAGNPRAILKVPQAWAELRKAFFSKGHEMSPMLEEWFKRGGFETLFQAQEIYDINRNRQFRHLMEFKLKRTPVENLINAPKDAWYKYWDFARKATDFREALLRYACFLDYAEQIQNSPDGNPLNYGASNREEIKGLKDPLDRAFKLANELLGAYDEVSVVGVWLSDHLLPFWRWNEVNFVRYIRIFKNAYQDGKLLAAVGRRVAGTPIRSVVLAMHIGKFVLRLCALSAMITAWNMLFFRDEEDDLPEDVKSRFHIILGRDDQGNVLYFSRLGALQDFLDWFGLDSAHIHIQNLLSGKRNVQEVVTEMAKAPLVKIGTALGPHVTIPVGLFLKQQLYPDPLKPRRVRDEWEFIFDSFGLKDEYRELTGKPTMGYGRSLYNVVVYKSDPLQAAYYSIKDEKIRFMKKLNKQSYDYAVVESPKSDALYNFKLALRYKDAEAAKKYLLEYFYAGGTTRGLKQSLKSLHPLHGLKDAEKKAFILQLDSEGREDLVKALEYYHSILNPE